MSLIEKAEYLAKGAENARIAGDVKASLELAIAAAQFLQLERILRNGRPKKN
jgi:hypothetical protein